MPGRTRRPPRLPSRTSTDDIRSRTWTSLIRTMFHASRRWPWWPTSRRCGHGVTPRSSNANSASLAPSARSGTFPSAPCTGRGPHLAMGSDWPVTDPNPLWAIHTAVHRTGPRADPHAIGPGVFDTPLLAERAAGPADGRRRLHRRVGLREPLRRHHGQHRSRQAGRPGAAGRRHLRRRRNQLPANGSDHGRRRRRLSRRRAASRRYVSSLGRGCVRLAGVQDGLELGRGQQPTVQDEGRDVGAGLQRLGGELALRPRSRCRD